MAKESVVIVGAGIIGICSAIELQRKGLQVTLLDPNGLGTQASSGNAGHFASEQVFPLADPSLLPQLPKILLDSKGPFRVRPAYFMRALPWFLRFLLNMLPARAKKNSRLIRQLNERAISSYQELLAHCSLSERLQLSGSLLIFETTSAEKIRKLHQSFVDEGVAVELLDRAAALQLEPNLADTVTSCLFFTEVGHTSNPAGLCTDLASHFLENGGQFYQVAVEEIIEQEQSVQLKVKEPIDGCQLVSFDRVMLCAGAWSKRFANQLGYKVPLDTERGYHLMVPKQNLLQRPVASAERKFIMTPMSEGLRLAGTVEFAGLDAEPDYSRAEMLLPHAKALLSSSAFNKPDNGIRGDVIKGDNVEEGSVKSDKAVWMGCRPSLPDSLPVMGPAPNHQRVYFNFGHQHLGLTWGAVVAKLMAQSLTGEKADIDLQPYSIARFN